MRLKLLLRSIGKHLDLLRVRAWGDLSDPNQTWLVIVVCLLSVTMALRMAQVAGWVHFAPLVKFPVPGISVLIKSSDHFWDSVTNASISSVTLLSGAMLTTISRLERWRLCMMLGLSLLMGWWYVTAAMMCINLGIAIGGMYAAVALTSSVATVKTLRAFDCRDAKEAEVDEAVKLVAAVLDIYSLGPREVTTQPH